MAPKICIQENAPVSETERAWLDELQANWGTRIANAGMDELMLIRFIRGYVNEEDPKKVAFDTIDNYLTWYDELDVSKIASTEFPHKSHFFSKVWPSGMHGMSKDGHPIYIDRPGKVDPSLLADENNDFMADFLPMHIQAMEHLNLTKSRLSKKRGENVYKHVVIFDLEDFGWKHFGEKFKGPMKKILDIDSTKYPESLHKMYIVNSGWVFKAIYAVVSPWLDDITKSRIVFCKTKELLQYIDADQLPDFLGGSVVYTEENPCFSQPFKSSNDELNDVFDGLLEECQEKHEVRLARLAEQEAAKAQEEAESAEDKAEEDGVDGDKKTEVETESLEA